MHWGHCRALLAGSGVRTAAAALHPAQGSGRPSPGIQLHQRLGPAPATNFTSLGLPVHDPPAHEDLISHFINYHSPDEATCTLTH